MKILTDDDGDVFDIDGCLECQCFDTVGLVIWPVKIVTKMTYKVLSGTLSLYTTTTAGMSGLLQELDLDVTGPDVTITSHHQSF